MKVGKVAKAIEDAVKGIETVPKITAANASKITPKLWTAAQDAAIARGDMTEAQRLRDLHGMIKGYDPSDDWHGSNELFYAFKETPHGIYFTPTEAAAEGYVRGADPTKYRVHLNKGNNTVTVDNEGLPWNKIEESKAAEALGISKEELYSMVGHYNPGAQPWYADFLHPFGYRPKTNYYAVDQIAKAAKLQGRTSLDIKNVLDNGKKITAIRNKNYDQHVVFKPNQIKSADAVTYDNSGVRIPLGERDNFSINDIRYSWLLPVLGVGAASTQIKPKQNKQKR